jgi:hypothetical protein
MKNGADMAEIGEPDRVVRRERETQPLTVPQIPAVAPETPELEPASAK